MVFFLVRALALYASSSLQHWVKNEPPPTLIHYGKRPVKPKISRSNNHEKKAIDQKRPDKVFLKIGYPPKLVRIERALYLILSCLTGIFKDYNLQRIRYIYF